MHRVNHPLRQLDAEGIKKLYELLGEETTTCRSPVCSHATDSAVTWQELTDEAALEMLQEVSAPHCAVH